MRNEQLFTNINTSFNQQQNPLKTFELPCDREYKAMNIGACCYFLLSEYPVDVKVYISLNPERKDAFVVDNRNTGFKITDVYSKEGVPSFVKDVYLWTEGITKLKDEITGGHAQVKIITSGIPSFEILNNSSVNSIDRIGQIGRIDGLVGYPQGAITLCGLALPNYVGAYQGGSLFEINQEFIFDLSNVRTNRDYMLMAKAVLDPELASLVSRDVTFSTIGSITAHFHAGVILPDTTSLPIPPNKMFPLIAQSYALVRQATDAPITYIAGGSSLNMSASYQYTGEYLLREFIDTEGKAKFGIDLRALLWGEGTLSPTTTNTKASYQIAAFEV